MSRARNLANLGNKNTLTGINTSGRVGIGSTIPDTKLDVDGTITATLFSGDGSGLTGTGQTVNVGTSNLFVVGVSTFGADGVAGTIRANGDTTLAGFVTASQGMRVGGSGLTGWNDGGDDLVIGNGEIHSHTGMTLYSHSNDNGSIWFSDSVTTNIVGLIQYRHSEDVLRINVADTEALRLNASGDLNVTGISTLTGQAHIGSGVTINSTGIEVTSGIITAGTCFKAGGGSFGPGIGATILGSGNAVFAGIVTATTLKVGVGATIHGSSGNAVFAGIVTATTLKYGTTSVETAIDAKASTGKAIAMAMVFGF